MDLLAYWQLRERPFETVWDSRYFFASRAHEEALHRLRYLATEGTMSVGLLTGEIGCGKTLTCAVFRDQLDPARYCVCTFAHCLFGFEDILAALLASLEEPLPAHAGRFALWAALEKALVGNSLKGRHCIVIFDEAQDLDSATLRSIKALTNLNGRGRSLLTVIFSGQPELQFNLSDLPSLWQRIGLRFHLRPLTETESAAYLEHRLAVAGQAPRQRLFSPEALRSLFELSRGIPRSLNALAKLAIEHAWVHAQNEVSPRAIAAIVADHAAHCLVPAA